MKIIPIGNDNACARKLASIMATSKASEEKKHAEDKSAKRVDSANQAAPSTERERTEGKERESKTTPKDKREKEA